MKDDKEIKEEASQEQTQEQQIPEEKAQEKVPAAETEEKEEKKEEKKLTPEEELAALQAKYLYLQAEYQNYRKRMVKELSDARRFAVEDTVQPFLAVYDFLTMAETAACIVRPLQNYGRCRCLPRYFPTYPPGYDGPSR